LVAVAVRRSFQTESTTEQAKSNKKYRIL
jgi:hypothetical protein